MIDIDVLRSPCCRARLVASAATLACGQCHHAFPLREYGPDLMPPDAEQRFDEYPQWQAVQAALTAWRTRTWTGTPDAQAATARAGQMGEAFSAWAGLTGRLLDIGCGGGWLRRTMPDAAYHGLDPMPTNLAPEFPFVRGLGDRLPFAEATFDTCIFFSSVDYAIGIENTLAEVRRVLKPGGRVAIASIVHATKAVEGERLHHYRFLPGELDGLVAQQFADVCSTAYQANFHFIKGQKA
jgi:SAM-dependent methyltransferase